MHSGLGISLKPFCFVKKSLCIMTEDKLWMMWMKREELSLTESADFHYLLTLMSALTDDPAYAWLPELFSIIGHEKLLLLCKYAGGTEIKIPTVEQLQESIEALRWFHQVYITKHKYKKSIPENLRPLVEKIYIHYKDVL